MHDIKIYPNLSQCYLPQSLALVDTVRVKKKTQVKILRKRKIEVEHKHKGQVFLLLFPIFLKCFYVYD